MDNINITNYVANKIKTFREKKNITQKELAEALNTTQQTIARYENGERKADQNVLFALANYFGISINDFFPSVKVDNNDEIEMLKKTLKKKGFLDENEDLSEENYNRLIDFAKANKPFIIKDTDNNK